MPSRNDSWGIEVGADAIKAMRLVRTGGRIELADFDILPFKQILTTPDLDVEEAIQVNLDAFLSKHDIGKSQVVVSVPGHKAFARFAKLPPVDPKEIPNIVRYEAVQQIPFPIEQVEWDYQVFQGEDSPEVEVGIFAITKERVAHFLSNFRRVNLRVDQITLSPLAVYNAFRHEHGEAEPGTIYMDIGASATDVIIVEQEGVWLRTLPIGGNNFTEALVRAFKLSFPKAERLKREAGASKYSRQIFQAMRPVFADLVQELQRSIGYYQSLNRDAELNRLVGVGSTFRLPGMQKFLKQQLGVEVVRPQKFSEIEVEGKREAELAENAVNLATAYGLALQGIGADRVTANLLPAAIQRQRMWKAKQPWIAASAACFATAAMVVPAIYLRDSSAWESTREATRGLVQPVKNQVSQYQQQWNEIEQQSDPRQRIENLRSVLEYRDLVPKIHEDVFDAAASLDPQSETLSADYNQLPDNRREWRRMFIDSVTIEYEPNGPEQSSPMERSLDAGNFWGSDEDDRPPRFLVTVTGTTPHANAGQLLNQNFIGWLRENINRKDRPYRLNLDLPNQPNLLTEFRRVRADEVESLRRSGTRSRRTRSMDGPPSGMPRGLPPEAYGEGTGRSGGSRGSGRSDSLYPSRPILEVAAGDQRFAIQWYVELLPPEEARKAQLGDLELPESGSEEGEQGDLPLPEQADRRSGQDEEAQS